MFFKVFLVLLICFKSWSFGYSDHSEGFFLLGGQSEVSSFLWLYSLQQMGVPKWSWDSHKSCFFCCNGTNLLDSVTDAHGKYFIIFSFSSTGTPALLRVYCCRHCCCPVGPVPWSVLYLALYNWDCKPAWLYLDRIASRLLLGLKLLAELR